MLVALCRVKEVGQLVTVPFVAESSGRAVPFVGIMAKAPRAGHAKTRLSQALAPAIAADLYRHFLLDTVAALRRVDGVALGLVCPMGDGPDLRRLDTGLPVVEQPVPGLMEGLAFGIDRFLGAGHSAVILVNGDSPTLPAALVGDALRALATHKVVLGPTADGGYYLIGATASCRALLCAEPYLDSATIYAQTLQRARGLDLQPASIAPWFDVDLPSELHHLTLALEREPAHVAPHTRRALRMHYAALRRLAADHGSD